MNSVDSLIAIPTLVERRIILVVFGFSRSSCNLHIYYFHSRSAHIALILPFRDLEGLPRREELFALRWVCIEVGHLERELLLDSHMIRYVVLKYLISD